MSHHRLLDQAAALWGIEQEFWDIWGNKHEATPEATRAILRSMGVACDTDHALEQAIAAEKHRRWWRLAPETLVVSGERGHIEVPLSVAAHTSGDWVIADVTLEQGGAEHCRVPLVETPIEGDQLVDGRQYLRRVLRLPFHLPFGYHTANFRLESSEETKCTTRLIVCPERAWQPESFAAGGKMAGVSISLYGVRSQRNWGCGDFTDLYGLIDWVAEDIGGSFLALNPLHAIGNRQPYNTSPYLPASIFYRNPLYLDIEAIPEYAESKRAQRLRAGRAARERIERLRNAEYVEYEDAFKLKLTFLRMLFKQFLLDGSARAAFDHYVRSEGERLHRFALYCALDEHLHRRNPNLWIWQDWPAEYRDPDSPACEAFAKEHALSVLFYEYVQWQVDRQLEAAQRHAKAQGLAIGLYHDLALATDRCGPELWANAEYYVQGCRVGAPPDDFAPNGQDWAFPPPNSRRHCRDGYQFLADSIRHNARHGGALRIDHVMRFFRLYWIPDGMDATQGTYVLDNAENLLRVLALESRRNEFLVVGEDLGTVSPKVREMLAHFGILSYRLFYFEKDGAQFRPPGSYPRQALVSSTTHDLPTLAGYWTGRDIEARRAAGLLPDYEMYRRQVEERQRDKQAMLNALFAAKLLPDWYPRSVEAAPELDGELHNAVIGFIVSTPCQMMVLNQEDLTKETEQQNLPGSTWQYPNWRRKMRYSVEELRTRRDARDFAVMLRNWLQRTGRLNETSSAKTRGIE